MNACMQNARMHAHVHTCVQIHIHTRTHAERLLTIPHSQCKGRTQMVAPTRVYGYRKLCDGLWCCVFESSFVWRESRRVNIREEGGSEGERGREGERKPRHTPVAPQNASSMNPSLFCVCTTCVTVARLPIRPPPRDMVTYCSYTVKLTGVCIGVD